MKTTHDNDFEKLLDGVACKNTNRNFIGIELDETYHKLSLERIENHTQQLSLIKV